MYVCIVRLTEFKRLCQGRTKWLLQSQPWLGIEPATPERNPTNQRLRPLGHPPASLFFLVQSGQFILYTRISNLISAQPTSAEPIVNCRLNCPLWTRKTSFATRPRQWSRSMCRDGRQNNGVCATVRTVSGVKYNRCYLLLRTVLRQGWMVAWKLWTLQALSQSIAWLSQRRNRQYILYWNFYSPHGNHNIKLN